MDMLLTPDSEINITDALTVVNHALDMIEPPDGRQDCFYLVQMDDDRTTTDANNSLDTASLDTSWGATHWPWVKYYDEQAVRFAWLPPTSLVAKAIARTWTERWPWIGAAGLKRGSGDGSVKDVRVPLKQADRDKLYENRINPIQKFAVENKIVVYGQKTLQVAESSLDRINARLGLNWIKKIIAGATKYMLFDPSDVFFWSEFVDMVKPHLDKMKEERGIYDFRVQMDENTNTSQIQDRNQVYGKIFLKLTKTAEDITLDFILLSSGAEFDEYL